ncbi:MAG: tripartite tricarboxylate transporter substrate binding protein [Burkholderiales bacterium]|nr:tripartite tricarboxylate transporter substrate binding protein [Burkholderiales bacterium]
MAQAFPVKPVRIVVPYPAGGPTDIISRLLAKPLAERWAQPVLIDNRGGAGGIIGTQAVAKSPPDGYTLLWGTGGTHAINPALYRKLPYHPQRDFAPITLVALGTNVLVVHPSVPAASVGALIKLARSQPGKLNFASSGNGATSHLAGELLRILAKVDTVHVPFKGAAPAIVALAGGEVDFAILDLPALLPHIRAGRLRALGVANRKRFAGLADVPTLIESGLPEFEASSWHGLWAPAGTPAGVVEALNVALSAVIKTPHIGEQMVAMGQEIVGNAVEDFERFLRAETSKWARVVAQAGARVD